MNSPRLKEPEEGFEPTTCCLRNSYSTTELPRLGFEFYCSKIEGKRELNKRVKRTSKDKQLCYRIRIAKNC